MTDSFHRSLDAALSRPERQEQDPHTDWGIDIRPFIEAADQAVRDLVALASEEPVAYDGFGAPLYAHQIPPEGTE